MHEKNVFDDLFEGTEDFLEVLNIASNRLSVEDIKSFHEYKNKRLETVPLDLLQIEEISEPTPSFSLDDDSKDTSEDESHMKSIQDSENSKHESQDSDHSENESENKDESPDKIIKYVTKGIDRHAEKRADEAGLEKTSYKYLQEVQSTPKKTIISHVVHLSK